MSFSFLMVLPKARRAGSMPSFEAPFDLARTGHVKAGSDIGQPLEHLGRRIGLHREKDPRAGQDLEQPEVASLDHIQVNDKKRRGQTRVVSQKPADRLCGSVPVDRPSDLRCAHPTMPLSICITSTPTPLNTANRRCFGESSLTLSANHDRVGWRTDSLATVHASYDPGATATQYGQRYISGCLRNRSAWALHGKLGDSFWVTIGCLIPGPVADW